MLVFTCGNRGLLVYSVDDGVSRKTTFKQKLDDECKLFTQSGDGKTLVYINRKGVHFVSVPSLQRGHSLPFERVQGVQFSPKSTFLSIYTAYMCKPNEQPVPNLFIVNCESGQTAHSYVQKRQTGWEPHWFADERYLARCFSNTVMLYEPAGDLSKFTRQINVERVADISLSPSVAKKYLASYVPSSGKGQPAFCRLFSVDPPAQDPLASKSFFKCDSVIFKWSPKGSDVLILATTEVDKTNTSYYGEQALHYANVKGDSCIVQLKKKGPLYHCEWNPTGENFCVVYGFMPAKATLFNLKCDPVWDLDEGPRNLAYFNPHGNILLTAGFGNLQGTVEAWDLEQKKRINVGKISDTTHLEFAADGQHFLTATLAPRLRVNNGFRLWHYTLAMKSEILADKDDPQSFDEMWRAHLQAEPAGVHPKPAIVYKKVEGVAPTAPKAAKLAYRPPGLRAIEEAQKAADDKKKNNKKKSKPKPKEPAEAPPAVAPAVSAASKLDEDDRKARAIKKKLSQIHVLKQRQAEGEALEPEQLEKISKEKELADELKQLEL